MDDDVAGMEDEVAGMSDDVAGMCDDVAAMEDDVAGMEDDVAGMNHRALPYHSLTTARSSMRPIFSSPASEVMPPLT